MKQVIGDQIASGDDVLAGRVAAAILGLVDACADDGVRTELLQRGDPVALERLTLAPRELAVLYDMGVLAEEGADRVRANVMVQIDPHLVLSDVPAVERRVVLITDWPDISPTEPHPAGLFDSLDMVFPLHYESLAVIKRLVALPEMVRDAATLDLFCGSGVLGVYASLLGAGPVVFADNVPRALAFARVNAHMNAVVAAKFETVDVFSGMTPDQRFDLILANPPFEAVSEEDQGRYFRHSFGGRDGQEFMNRFLREVVDWLSPHGIAVAVDFLIADLDAEATKALLRECVGRFFDLQSTSLALTVLDKIPLRDFWIRFDALGLDVGHRLRDSYPRAALARLLLATLEIRHANPSAGVPAGLDCQYADAPPPVPWWNPMGWPLPTGIRRDEHTMRTWLFAWAEHEAEKRGEFGALQAERFVSDSDRVVPWDFSNILSASGLQAVDPTARAVFDALLRLADDARFLSLLNAIVPSEADIVLLAGTDDLASECVEIRSPWNIGDPTGSLSRPQVKDDSRVRQIPCTDINRRIAEAEGDPARLLFFFTIKDPALLDERSGVPGARDFTDLGYHAIAEGCLMYRGESFRPRGNGNGPIPNQVQRFVLDLRLPTGAPYILESMSPILGVDWKPRVYEQCFRFMRDRLTLLAILMIMIRNRDDELRNSARSRIFAFLRHSLDNTIVKEITDSSQPAVVRRHLYLDRLMLRAAEVAGEKPKPGETSWRNKEFGKEPLGQTLKTVFHREGPRDPFLLNVDDAAIENASVDPRFAAIVVELTRNLFKRAEYDTNPTMRLEWGDHGGINVTVDTKGFALHAGGIVRGLRNASAQLVAGRDSELRSLGLGFVAQLSCEISTLDRYAASWSFAYLDTQEHDEMVREEDPFGRWVVTGPSRIVHLNKDNMAIPISIRITISECAADTNQSPR